MSVPLHIGIVACSAEGAALCYRTICAEGAAVLGLTGTHWLLSSEVYSQKLKERGLACIRPSDTERDEMGRLIMDELVHGVFRSDTVAYFQKVIGGFQANGCDAVILGCTEIPLIINDRNSTDPHAGLHTSACTRSTAPGCPGSAMKIKPHPTA
jgi:aspartate/glutamate racemase